VRLSRRAFLATGATLLATPASAVIVLDSTYHADEFRLHTELARRPQFRSLFSLSEDQGTTYGTGSGAWIGNDADFGYVLTSAHNFDEDYDESSYVYSSTGGTHYQAEDSFTHPGWSGSGEDRTGCDATIVRLSRRVTDAGPQPLLYSGRSELRRRVTLMGYGSRGIGTGGQNADYDAGDNSPAAAEGLIERVVDTVPDAPRGTDSGNYFGITLPKEDGSVANRFGGPRRPVSRLAGLLGSGDSGGPAWLEIDGRWVIAGINTNGDDSAAYGDAAWFTRISGIRNWISAIFPQARFYGGS
jgi:hypothetical protein